MNIPPSDLFTPIDLTNVFNADRSATGDDAYFGQKSFRGMPFALGLPNQNNVLSLTKHRLNLSLSYSMPAILSSYMSLRIG